MSNFKFTFKDLHTFSGMLWQFLLRTPGVPTVKARTFVSARVRMRGAPSPHPCRATARPRLRPEAIRGMDGQHAWERRFALAPDAGEKWHKDPDRWRSLRWKTASTGCSLFCFFPYQVSALFLCKLLTWFCGARTHCRFAARVRVR